MKLFLIIGGLFIIAFICIIPLSRDIQEYNVQKNGELITATITYIPICSGTKAKYSMKFAYAGQEFTKTVGCGFANSHKAGDMIKLKHLNGIDDIFLFENENKKNDFIADGLLGILGVTLIISGVRKK